MSWYELALLGSPTDQQVSEIEGELTRMLAPFGLRLQEEVGWAVRPQTFEPSQRRAAGAAFFATPLAPTAIVEELIRNAVPVIPIISEAMTPKQLPGTLAPYNCLHYEKDGPSRIASALLECVGLLPRQRRLFLSYRHDESRSAAIQLFEAFSSRVVDVFLDSHKIAPAEDFQQELWHRLCDADVMVMLDTPLYFGSRWTAAEFGRALAKGIVVLRVSWPLHSSSPRVGTTTSVDLVPEDINDTTGHLSDAAIERICERFESVRSEGIAVRYLNLISTLTAEVERIGGTIVGVEANKTVHVELMDGRTLILHPAIGVPTSSSLHDAALRTPSRPIAVVYDDIGIKRAWVDHLEWLGEYIHDIRWIRSHQAGYSLADWRS